jgi:hypothetical protein
MIGENRFNRRSRTRIGCVAPSYEGTRGRANAVELSFKADVLVAVKIEEEVNMGRGLLLWLIGIPIPIILLIWLFGGLHG